MHGCGGYIKTIKSPADIDFSKVEVQLLTKSGVKKDNVEANPTNGYYFLPVYEKGDYVLKVRLDHLSRRHNRFLIDFDWHLKKIRSKMQMEG